MTPAVRAFTVFLLTYGQIFSSVKQQVQFFAVGDVLLDREVRKTIESKGISFLFEKVYPVIGSGDLAMCNLECPFADSSTGYPLLKKYSFRCDPCRAEDLRKAGFNLVSVANNHTIDRGRDGFKETWYTLKKNGISPVGGGMSQIDANNPAIVQAKGLSFALFGSVSFLLDGIVYKENAWGPAQTDIDTLAKRIRAVLPKVDYVIVSFHWGQESISVPDAQQREYAHKAIDAGADLVIGHHPHVLQGCEWYRSRMIVYSLGNFVFDNRRKPQTRSAIFSCTFSSDTISSYRIIPVVIKGNRPEPAQNEEADEIIDMVSRLSAPFNTLVQRDTGNCVFLHGATPLDETTHRPLKSWIIAEKIIDVYPDRIEVKDHGRVTKRIKSLGELQCTIKDACFIQDSLKFYVCSIIENAMNDYKKQIAIFPFNTCCDSFETPRIDCHDAFNPWKIRAADIDGNGVKELVMGVFKSTRYDSVEKNRVFVFNFRNGSIYSKWLGSSLGVPFTDFEIEEGTPALVRLWNHDAGKDSLFYFKWNGFGFDLIHCRSDSALTPASSPD